MGAYAASKGAIAAFTQTLAVEYCKEGVRVNAVAPGSVHSGITAGVDFPSDLSKEEGRLVRRIMSPTGFGDPADVAGVVTMLLSDDAKHITGECIRIDGGTHA
jgi:NAD(P)-dependent dehydrogenase (short-subunit alcohol dehydrogenase family)